MNLQAKINAEMKASASPNDKIEVFAPHERQSQDTPQSQSVPSSDRSSASSIKKKQAGMAMMFQRVEAGKDVPIEEVEEKDEQKYDLEQVSPGFVRKQQSEVQFDSEAIAKGSGRRQVQSTHEQPDYLAHAISMGEMDFKSRENTERDSGPRQVGAAFKNKHRKFRRSLAAAEARQRKANAKSVSVA